MQGHPLKVWIEKHTSQAKFAREVEISESHLSDILGRKKSPSLDLAARMSKATGRAVSVDRIAAAAPAPGAEAA